MRVVLDTNILVSAVIVPASKPAAIVKLRATLQKPRVAELIKPHKAGRLVNQIRELVEDVVTLPRVQRSPDPEDALAEAGQADYLVTGDKSGSQGHANSFRAGVRRAPRSRDEPVTDGFCSEPSGAHLDKDSILVMVRIWQR